MSGFEIAIWNFEFRTRSATMPTFQFEAMDKTGQEVRDVIEAASQEEAQATIRQRGLFVTKIA